MDPAAAGLSSTKLEPEAQVFAWAQLEGGARFDSMLRFEAIEAQGGVKLAGSFAGEDTQATDPDYASSYALSFEASAGAGRRAAGPFLQLAKVAVALL